MKLSWGFLIVIYKGKWIGNNFLGSIYEDEMRYLERKVIEISSQLPQGVLMMKLLSLECCQIAKRARSKAFSQACLGSFARRSKLSVPICMMDLFMPHKRCSANGLKL